MTLPLSSQTALWLAPLFGLLFGWLLNKGGVTSYDVIVNQFRLRDFTVVKIMFTAVVVGAVGVFFLHGQSLAAFHIKDMNTLGIVIGALLFGVGMVLYGYCPGTGVAAVGTGSLHALVGLFGMLFGGMLYAWSYPWIKETILPVGAFGKLRLGEMLHLPDFVLVAGLVAMFVGLIVLLRRFGK